MAYVTGTATDIADLATAVRNACTANGWTADDNDIIHRSGLAAHVRADGAKLALTCGNGVTNGALDNPGPSTVRIQSFGGGLNITWPLTYFIHVMEAPTEVYVIVSFAVNHYEWMAFGQSPTANLPGTGNWYGASTKSSTDRNGICIQPSTGGFYGTPSGALFYNLGHGSPYNCCFHHGVDGGGWSEDVYASSLVAYQLGVLPNTWNHQSVFLPIQPIINRASGKRSIVGELGHARYARIDNLEPEAIVTLGTDKWKIYPWLAKNAASRNGGGVADGIQHSGTMGWAVRYDGPSS